MALRVFYETFTRDDTAPEARRLELVRKWVSSRPESISARIALAGVAYSAGWKRRGSGYTDSITASGAAEFEKFLREAQHALDKAGKSAEADPYYWVLRIVLAANLGNGDVREIARRGIALHQDPEIAERAAGYLKPEWGGSVEKYMAFADEAARLTRDTWGDVFYMWLAYHPRANDIGSSEGEEYNVDWNRWRKGARELIDREPQWLPSYHRLAKMACVFEDRTTAAELFETPQLDWYDGAERMWFDRSMYEQARLWALTKPPVTAPFVKLDRAQWPRFALGSELKDHAGVSKKVTAFLLETSKGVIAVSAVPASPEKNPVLSAQRRKATWTISSPASSRRMSATILATDPSEDQRGVALALTPPPDKHAPSLKRGTTDSGPVFIVGCAWGSGDCEQKIITGTIHLRGSTGSPPKQHRTFTILLAEQIDPDSLLGAAVLDENGWAIALVTGRSLSTTDEGILIDADDLASVVAQ